MILIAAAAAVGLASCAKKSTKPVDLYAEAVTNRDAMNTRVGALAYSAPGEIPTTGRGTFDGFTTIAVDLTPEIKGLLGEADLVVRFSTGKVTGTLGKFSGFDSNGDFVAQATGTLTVGKTGPEQTGLDANNNPIVEILEVSGVTPGTNGAAAGGFNAGLYGQLKIEGHSIYLDGILLGNFHGTGAEALTASADTTADSGNGHFRVVVIDGDVVHGNMPYDPEQPVGVGAPKTVTLLIVAED